MTRSVVRRAGQESRRATLGGVVVVVVTIAAASTVHVDARLRFLIVFAALVIWWRARGRARRWAAGAAGEDETAGVLEAMQRDGFLALHDRRLPGADRANIDHVVVGPTGVFTVETKRYAGVVHLRGVWGLGRLRPWHNQRRADGGVRQATWQADAVSRALSGAPVTPLVVVHGATLRKPRWRRPLTNRVRWCEGGDGLVGALRRGPRRLSKRQVHATFDRLDRALVPSVTERVR